MGQQVFSDDACCLILVLCESKMKKYHSTDKDQSAKFAPLINTGIIDKYLIKLAESNINLHNTINNLNSNYQKEFKNLTTKLDENKEEQIRLTEEIQKNKEEIHQLKYSIRAHINSTDEHPFALIPITSIPQITSIHLTFDWIYSIGTIVRKGQVIGFQIGDLTTTDIYAPCDGFLEETINGNFVDAEKTITIGKIKRNQQQRATKS